jgi:WD40 repeat protein
VRPLSIDQFGTYAQNDDIDTTPATIPASITHISKDNVDDIVELRVLEGHEFGVTSIAFNPNGQSLLSSSFGTTPILWDIQTGNIIHRLEGHTGDVPSVAIGPDGRTALSGSVDLEVILWDLETAEIIHSMIGHSNWVLSVAYSPDGNTGLSGSADTTLIYWDLDEGIPIRPLIGHRSGILSVAISPDGKLGASGSCGRFITNDDSGLTCVEGELFIWDLNSGERIKSLTGHEGTVMSVTFSSDGLQLLSGATDNTLILWDVESGNVVRRFPSCDECDGHTRAVRSVSLSSDSQLALSGSDDGSVILWDVESGEILREFELDDPVRSVSFSNNPVDQMFAAGGSDRKIRLWGLP